MRKLVLLCLVSAIAFSCDVNVSTEFENTWTDEEVSIEEEKEAIIQRLRDQQIAWNEGDLEKFMVGYLEADSLMFVGISGIIYGYDNTLTRYKNNYSSPEEMGTLNFTIDELKPVTDDVYFMVGKYYLTREEVGDTNGIFTLVWKKLNGEWVIVADHSESADK